MGTIIPARRLPILDPYGAPEIFANKISMIDRVGDVGRFVFTIPGCLAEDGLPAFEQMQLKLMFPLLDVPRAIDVVRQHLSGVRIGNDPPLFPGQPAH